MAAAAALPVMLAVQAAGTIVGGMAQNEEARAGARVDEENARLTTLQGEQEAMQTRRDERSLAGDMMAAMAGSGTMLDGSNADLVAQSAYQRELEILNLRTQRAGESRNLMQAAKDKRRAGKNALIQAGFGAVNSALSGVSTARNDRLLAAQGQRERNATLTGSIKVPVPRGTMMAVTGQTAAGEPMVNVYDYLRMKPKAGGY